VIGQHESRRVVPFGVTEHPTDEGITKQSRDATPFEEKPQDLLHANIKKYGPMFERSSRYPWEVIHCR
jgi:hypothetical protein